MAERDDLIPLWNQMTTRKSSSIANRAWQRMLSGRRLDLLDPSPLDIEIARRFTYGGLHRATLKRRSDWFHKP